MSELIDIIDRIGRAQVIVALSRGAAQAAAAEPVRVEEEFGRHFVPMAAEQAEELDREADARAGVAVARRVPTAERHVRIFPNLGVAIGYVDAEGLAALGGSPMVERIVRVPKPRLIRPVAAVAADAPTQTSWGIRRLGIDRLWAQGLTGRGVLIGHVDTGVDGTHPDLAGRIAAFAEFDLTGQQVVGAAATDSGHHGTHTAGTLCGRHDTAHGSFGCAPGARLASAMVIEGGRTTERIVAGLEWVVSQKVRVLSMSLGFEGFDPAFEVITKALRAHNILPVVAVGNEGPGTSRSPGNYETVLSVGACTIDDEVSDFSSSQTFLRPADPRVPDLVAPGGASDAPLGAGVISCIPGGGHAELSGTSMATPHIAGLAAVLLEAVPEASASDLEQVILASCRRSDAMPPARANRGVPDGPRALALLRERAGMARAALDEQQAA